MTPRTPVSLLCLALAAACSSPTPTTDIPVVTDDDKEDTGDSGMNEPDEKRVAEFSWGGWFGWDADLGQVVSTQLQGNDQPSIFYVELRSEAFANGDQSSDEYCRVRVELEGYTGEEWATTAGYGLGFTVPQGTATGWDDCIDKGFDPKDPYWLGSDPFTVFSDPAMGWGIAIGGDPSQRVSDWLDSEPEDELNFIGGEFVTAGGGFEDTIYFLSWELDGSNNILEDNRILRDATTDVDGALVTGYYQFDVMVHGS